MAYLDMVEGSSLLPHVYCKKIILDREKVLSDNQTEQKTENINITLKLELLANSKNVHSSWLSQYAPSGENGKKSTLFDSLFVQVIPVLDIGLLRPSNDPLSVKAPVDGGNVYVSGPLLGKNWLPRGAMPKILGLDSSETGYSGLHSLLENNFFPPPSPLQVSTSTSFGSGQPLNLNNSIQQGKIREEVINGKGYYVVPLEYNFTAAANASLGFIFYSFLHVPHYLQANFDSISDDSVSKFEDYILEGPINTEIVFENGEPLQQREAFFLPGGKIWEGSVHLHGPDNPDPTGYFGDGGFGFNQGWMVGEKHIPGVAQPKLELAEYPNYKIDDFRGSLNPPSPPNVLGIVGRGDLTSAGPRPELQLREIGELLGSFEKKTKKYFTRDNDDEYSNMYLTRDAAGSVRGLFFIDFDNLLRNNSNIYSMLWAPLQDTYTLSGVEPSTAPLWVPQVLLSSKLIELKLFRDRINEHSLGRGYENFKNDTAYEEASKLIATIGDVAEYGTSSPSPELFEISLRRGSASKRFFSFMDRGIRDLSAGTYQYRIEMKFKDGTYQFLNKFLHEMMQARKNLMIYYNLSLSGVRDDKLIKNYRTDLVSSDYKKSVFKAYYDTVYQSFRAEFITAAQEVCEKNHKGEYVWEYAIDKLKQARLLLTKDLADMSINTTLASMVNPEFGSPEGIDLFIKFFDTIIRKLQVLTSVTKNKPGGGALTSKNSSNFSNNIDKMLSSPSATTIHEEHSFDDPNSIYKVDSTNTIFVDYLGDSMKSVTNANFYGLKNLSVEFFKARCQLDAAKFTNLALTSEGFNTANVGLFVPDTDYYNSVDKVKEAQETGFAGPEMQVKIENSDFLTNTAYSYLTPSNIYYRDASRRAPRYVSSFVNNSVAKVLVDKTDVLSPHYQNSDYGSLFAELINYTVSKKETNNADVRNIYDPSLSKTNTGVYKNLTSKLGVTFHQTELYSNFFEKEPGAVNGRLDGTDIKPFNQIYPLKASDYSDAASYGEVASVLASFLESDPQKLIKVPSADITGYQPGYSNVSTRPNNFKMARAYFNRKEYGKTTSAPSKVEAALQDPSKEKSFIFFHFNMTMAVEVFTGFSYNTIPKNDQNYWRLLSNKDLDRVSSDPKLRLFCRLRYYNEKLIEGIDVPILNKYFTISDFANPNSYQEVLIPLETGWNSKVIPPSGIDMWKKQNQQTAIGNLTAESQEVQQGATQTSPSSGGAQIDLSPGSQGAGMNNQGSSDAPSGYQ